MKLLLVFAFCGVTCCLAGPTCSREDVAKCVETGRFEPGSPRLEEETLLNIQCRQTTCYLEIYDRCGSEYLPFPFPAKGYQKLVDGLCDTSSPLRKKYIENAGCIRDVAGADKWVRLCKNCGIEFTSRDEFCRIIPDGFVCLQDYITRKCGKDAGEAFKIAGLPGADPYDCMSS